MSRQVRKGLALIATTATAAALSLTGVAAAHADGPTASPVYLTFEPTDAYGVASSFGDWYHGTNTAKADADHNNAYQITQKDCYAGMTISRAGTAYTSADHSAITLDINYQKSNDAAPDSSRVLVKLETTPAGNEVQTFASIPATGWNNGITVDFSEVEGWNPSQNYSGVSIFPGFDCAGGGTFEGSYWLDNISINGGTLADEYNIPAEATPLYMSFGNGDDLGAAAANQAFEGGSASIVTDAPSDNGHALKFIKSGQDWAGINMIVADSSLKLTETTDAGTEDEVANTKTSFRIWSPEDATADEPVMTPVQIELHNAAGGHLTDVQEIAPGWNTVTTDWSTIDGYSVDAKYSKFVVFPDFGSGEGIAGMVPVDGQVYYIDNVSVNGGLPTDGAADGTVSIKLDPASAGTITNNPGDGWWNEECNAWEACAGTGGFPPVNSHSIVRYLEAGTDMTLSFHVTDEFGEAAASQWVNFAVVNPAGKATSFKWKTEYYTLDADGNKVYKGKQKTNARGDVIVTIHSNATRAEGSENRRADLTAWSAPAGAEHEIDVIPSANGAFANPASYHRDRVWTHVIAPKTNAPQNVTVIRGNGLAIVDWDAPVAEDGVTVTGYKVLVSGLGATRTYTTDDSDTDLTVDGLTNGVKRTIAVVAETNALDSNPSDAVFVTPSKVSAKVPGRVKLGPLFTSPHTFDFDYALGSDNGATVTGVEYSADGGESWLDADSTHITVDGLTNGVRSTILVRAVNAIGEGPAVRMSGRAPFIVNVIHFDALQDADALAPGQDLVATSTGGTDVLFKVVNWGKVTCAIENGKIVGIKSGRTCTVKAYTSGDADYGKAVAYQSFSIN